MSRHASSRGNMIRARSSFGNVRVRRRELEIEIGREHRGNETSRRLETIPGFGVMTSTAMAATVADPTAFKSGREFAAWLGYAKREFIGRQATARRHHQDGRRISSNIAGCRSDGGDPLRPRGRVRRDGVDPQAHGEKTCESRGGCACQQDGAHSLGAHDEKERFTVPSPRDLAWT
ncbi:hypothetical protein CO661_32545 [Sinorhizobium fredii]|uniref:Transposase IS116/IS110/IS902 C-terminal domain-containing protein n=1 Tax=Rhizobium fredii TaxID=380 RepID=A0A2A6LP44_RHIFR|nr:hypothetical protein CO661_32545 [Sinorhizobium fredii]